MVKIELEARARRLSLLRVSSIFLKTLQDDEISVWGSNFGFTAGYLRG